VLCRVLYRRQYCGAGQEGEEGEEGEDVEEGGDQEEVEERRRRRGAGHRAVLEPDTEVIELIAVGHLCDIYKSVLLL
jgi:hypothetical protein